jgi:hypothetical protein
MKLGIFYTLALLAQVAVKAPQSLYWPPVLFPNQVKNPIFKKMGYLNKIEKFAIFQLFGRQITATAWQYYATSNPYNKLCFQVDLRDSLNAYGVDALRFNDVVHLNKEPFRVLLF